MITSDKHLQNFGYFLSSISSAAASYPTSVTILIKYTSTPIESEIEVLERAKVMDRMMEMPFISTSERIDSTG